MRRTAVFFCLGLVIFAALLPVAVIVTPALSAHSIAVDASWTSGAIDGDAVSPPLLVRITPLHLARASLRPCAA